jgi:predicted component of type VI protein secretion system
MNDTTPPNFTDLLLPPGLAAEAGLLRDQSRLLNTRSRFDLPASDPLARTLLGYGVPASAVALYDQPERYGELCEAIRATIVAFEPRLKDIRVSPAGRGRSTLTLLIQGRAGAGEQSAKAVLHADGHFDLLSEETR